jgi:hypothetical protein
MISCDSQTKEVSLADRRKTSFIQSMMTQSCDCSELVIYGSADRFSKLDVVASVEADMSESGS